MEAILEVGWFKAEVELGVGKSEAANGVTVVGGRCMNYLCGYSKKFRQVAAFVLSKVSFGPRSNVSELGEPFYVVIHWACIVVSECEPDVTIIAVGCTYTGEA